ncbi:MULTISPECIES: recombinase family protein [unclassified Streptomyces]|uniref:recombinase family protein n=1 Tax=unclassified Streptomyces TaxID=2593676 RepID=UPI0036E1277E
MAPHAIERPYDGCGKCLLGVRRLSRVKLATSSPERQRENVLAAAASVGAHIIGWADDWEVSGATDPVSRPKLGSWLRDEKGPYDGLVAAAVDRLGRNVVDCLNTGYKMRDEKKMLVTYGHDGPWELDDSADENRFTMEAWGAQMELRAIQRRNRDATVKIRAAGRPKGKPSYGFQYVWKVMGGKVDHVEPHPPGQCHARLYTQTSKDAPPRYTCTTRNKGSLQSQNCRPSPLIQAHLLDSYVEEWFLRKLGDGLSFETVHDPGDGIPERIAETRANRVRLRADREAGLYDSSDDASWFRERYAALGRELAALETEPQQHQAWSGGRRVRPSRTAGSAHRMYRPGKRS